MSSIQPISNTNNTSKSHFSNVSKTGFLALAGIGLATASASIKKSTIKKHHKQLGYIAMTLSLLHLGTAIHFKSKNEIDSQAKFLNFKTEKL